MSYQRPSPDEHEHTENRTKHSIPYTVVWLTPMKREGYAIIYFKTGEKSTAEAVEHKVPQMYHDRETAYLGPEELEAEVGKRVRYLHRVRAVKE